MDSNVLRYIINLEGYRSALLRLGFHIVRSLGMFAYRGLDAYLAGHSRSEKGFW